MCKWCGWIEREEKRQTDGRVTINKFRFFIQTMNAKTNELMKIVKGSERDFLQKGWSGHARGLMNVLSSQSTTAIYLSKQSKPSNLGTRG